jgi:ATP-dependent Lhr-like helicase
VVSGEFRPGGTAREWCDAEVLRRLRRRSLAVLRREVEPVEPEALARFLPAWQGCDARFPGVDRTFEAIEQLAGAPLPASVWERDVLPVRVKGYSPAWLDELSAAGEVVWVGRGPLGSGDGRIALYLRDRAPLLVGAPADTYEQEPWWSHRHAALLAHLDTRGASFWPALYTAAGGGDEAEAVEALWDLVWAGLVTNDTLAPVRALVGGPTRGGRARGTRPGSARPRTARRAPRSLSRSGPPRVAGRWSLVTDLLGASPPGGTERATALATQLLDRHGVLTRDAVAAEDVPGGFSAVYGVLKAMEEAGRARRGYFVEGLGGAQFAVPGAVDRLRAVREGGAEPESAQPLALAATDPANPYGAALPWPEPGGEGRHAPRRVAGASVVLLDGRLLLYAERGGRSLVTFSAAEDDLAAAAAALAGLVADGRVASLQIGRVDGQESLDHPLVAHLRDAGFTDHPRGLILR